MAKFLKSFFQPNEKRKSLKYDGHNEEEKSEYPPPLDGRRKLSISRSGRMRQANRKRHSLSLELYGADEMKCSEKPKSVEYHVNIPSPPVTAPVIMESGQRRRSADDKTSRNEFVISAKTMKVSKEDTQSQKSGNSSEYRIKSDVKSAEEEIDSAFEIIEKTVGL